MKIKPLSFVFIAGTFLFQFCSDNNPVESETETGKTASAVIGSSGGSVKTEDGITLLVPQGALNEDTEIKVTSVDGNSFSELCVVGAKLEPDGLTFNTPATIRFPLPKDWEEDEFPVIYESSGSDLSNFLIDGISGNLTGSPGAYFCEVEVSHFSSLGAARNCHAGTVDFLLDDFLAWGCSIEEMTNQVTETYGNKFTINKITRPDKVQEFNLFNIPMQCFLATYFDNKSGFESGEPVTGPFFNTLTDYLNEGRQVVVAFARQWQNVNGDGFYTGFDHSALLEIKNGQLKLRQSISIQKDSIVQALIDKNGKNVFWYPKQGELTTELLNQFRESHAGISLENEICGSPGCLFKSEVDNRVVPYPAVRFYVSKYSEDKNPCEVNNGPHFTKCTFQVVVGPCSLSVKYYDSGNTSETTSETQGLTGKFIGSFSENTFTGTVDTSVYNNSSVTGSISITLNDTYDLVTNVRVSFNVDNQYYTSTNRFEGINISSTSSSSFNVAGNSTCDHVTYLSKQTIYEDHEETLSSFECNIGNSSYVSISFSE